MASITIIVASLPVSIKATVSTKPGFTTEMCSFKIALCAHQTFQKVTRPEIPKYLDHSKFSITWSGSSNFSIHFPGWQISFNKTFSSLLTLFKYCILSPIRTLSAIPPLLTRFQDQSKSAYILCKLVIGHPCHSLNTSGRFDNMPQKERPCLSCSCHFRPAFASDQCWWKLHSTQTTYRLW